MTIAARANATPLVLLPRTAIPSSGAVDVDLQALNGAATTPLLQGNGGGVTGNLWVNGVPIPGSISLVQPGGGSATFNSSTDYYRFTRSDTGGAAITTIRPYRFTYDFADAHRDDIHIISIGQNGPAHPRPLYDAQAIIQRMSALDKRFLVVNKPSSTDAEDAAYHDAFGRRYFPLRKYLVAYGLADAGLSATAQDNTDIAAGTVPTSLRIDAVHGNAAYYHIWGQQLFNRLVELGWV
ncbi:MAG: hypothetical protein HOV83_24040 [Catenulispora sp.]|nr:hypothetical protein [Catenulispora sp.]